MQTLRRIFGLTLSFGLIVPFAWAQIEPSISFTLPASTAKRALEILSKQAEIPLTASPQVADEILALRFRNVPLKQAMARIADAVDGTWKKISDGYVLTRTSTQVTAERNREHGELIQRIKNALAKQTELAQSLPAATDEELDRTATKLGALIKRFDPTNQSPHWFEESAKLNALVPINRCLRELIGKFDPEELASISPNSQLVWSTNPTAVQRSLSEGATAVLFKLAQQQNEWQSAMERHSVSNPRINGATVYLGDYGGPEQPNVRAKSIDKILLIIRNNGGFADYSAELSAYDDTGKLVTNSSINVKDDSDYKKLTVRKDEEVTGEKLIQASPAQAAFSAATASYPRAPTPLSGDWLQIALHPDQFDPLSAWVSDSILEAAKIRNLNMVACLCDSSAYAGKIGDGKDVSVAQFLARLRYCRSNVELKDGWLTITPNRPAYSRANRVDRQVLAGYLQRLSQHRDFSIEERAHFAYKLPDSNANLLPSLMAQVVGENAQSPGAMDLLRLLGSLNLDQAARLREGELPLATLSEEQLVYANRIIYGLPGALQFSPPLNATGVGAPRLSDWQLHTTGILKEPTEALPNGIPKQAVLSLKVDSSPVAAVASPGQQSEATKPLAMDPRQMAFFKFSQDHPDAFSSRAMAAPTIDLFHLIPGVRHQWSFLFRLTGSLSVLQSFEATTFDANRATSLDNFPEDFRKAFGEAYKEYVQTYSPQKGDVPVTSSGNPPP